MAVWMYSSPMPREFRVEKLSDEFGQYVLILKCGSCLRERRTTPNMIARITGWDARLVDVAKRMRCSTCGAKACSARAIRVTVPRGYKSH